MAGWLRSASQAPATAETSSRLSPVKPTTPASFRYATAARSARQAIGRPPPALAGQRSAFLPTARRAPLSHNGAWWVVANLVRGCPPTTHHSHYAKRPSLRSTRRGLSFHAGLASFTAWGWSLARAGKLPPHHPAHPRPAAVGIADARPRLCAPRREGRHRGQNLAAAPPRGFGLEGGFGRAGEGGIGQPKTRKEKNFGANPQNLAAVGGRGAKSRCRFVVVLTAFSCVFLRFDAQREFPQKSPQSLYLCGLRGEPAVGFEPTTDGLQNRCSTTELCRRGWGSCHRCSFRASAAF